MEDQTLANITDIRFPDRKAMLRKKISNYKNEIFPEQNENLCL